MTLTTLGYGDIVPVAGQLLSVYVDDVDRHGSQVRLRAAGGVGKGLTQLQAPVAWCILRACGQEGRG